MNPFDAFTSLATSLPVRYRKIAYQVSLLLVVVVAAFMYLHVPAFLSVAWETLFGPLGVASAVLNGVANANAGVVAPSPAPVPVTADAPVTPEAPAAVAPEASVDQPTS